MSLNFLPEPEYLIRYGLAAWKTKFSGDISYTDCTIVSTTPSYGYKYGYEIKTLRGDDYIKIRIYFNAASYSQLDLVRAEVTQNTQATNALGDEVYVVLGFVNDEDGHYLFRPIVRELVSYPLSRPIEGSYFTFMSGEPFLLSGGGFETDLPITG